MYTPGPWCVDWAREESGLLTVGRGLREDRNVVRGGTWFDEPVCRLVAFDGRADANARLIAAAPALLAAAEAALDILADRPMTAADVDGVSAVAQLRAAITLAKGGAA